MANRINIVITAEDKASKPLHSVADEIDTGSKSADRYEGALTAVQGALTGAAVIAGGALVTGIGASVKASFDQVNAVEQATVALGAYEKNGDKVNEVLKGLVGYARSDMGVLFQRQDLFAAAQGLKVMGDNTEQLTDHVKIMSRSVGLGLSSWGELTQIVGRIGSTSRLTGDDFDNLTKAGYKLNPSLRNTNITFDKLFKAMDKGIPADAMAGQANTIQGKFVKLQSAFRDVGASILGVDKETSAFIKGGLGDRFVGGIDSASGALKSMRPVLVAVGTGTAETLQSISEFAAGMSRATGIIYGLSAGVLTYSAVEGAATVKTAALTFAQNALNAAMRINPFALVAAAAVGITAAYVSVVTQSDKSTSATDRLKSAQDALRASTDAAKDAQNRLKDAYLTQEGSSLAVEAAQKRYNEAVKQYGPKSLEARQAAHDLKEANQRLKDANEEVRKKTKEAQKAEEEKKKASAAVVKANDAVAQSAHRAAGGYAQWAADVNKAIEADKKAPNRGYKNSTEAFLGLKKHAIGTSYAPGGPTVVGENGPELLNLPRGSQVIPNYRSRSMASQTLQNTTTINEYGTYIFQTAEAVAEHEKRRDKTQRLAKIGMA